MFPIFSLFPSLLIPYLIITYATTPLSAQLASGCPQGLALSSACRCQSGTKGLQVECTGPAAVTALELLKASARTSPNGLPIQQLKLTNLPVTEIYPNAFYPLQVEILVIENSQVHTIYPLAFNGLQASMRYLSLSNNQIQQIPTEALGGLEALQVLNLACNRIGNISFGQSVLQNLTGLRDLSLACNQICKVDHPSLKALGGHLKNLILDDNCLTEIPGQALQNFQQLQHLSIRRNKISRVGPFDLVSLPKLETFRLSGNAIFELNRMGIMDMPNLRFIFLDRNKIRNIDPTFFPQIPALEGIELSWNHLSELQTNTFEGLRSLKEISLIGNQLLAINPEAFGKRSTLQTLLLQKNCLQVIYDLTFKELYNIQYLSLGDNSIQAIEKKAFQRHSTLKTLDLSGNYLKSLPDFIGNTATVLISENPVVCKLGYHALQNGKGIRLLNETNEICRQPQAFQQCKARTAPPVKTACCENTIPSNSVASNSISNPAATRQESLRIPGITSSPRKQSSTRRLNTVDLLPIGATINPLQSFITTIQSVPIDNIRPTPGPSQTIVAPTRAPDLANFWNQQPVVPGQQPIPAVPISRTPPQPTFVAPRQPVISPPFQESSQFFQQSSQIPVQQQVQQQGQPEFQIPPSRPQAATTTVNQQSVLPQGPPSPEDATQELLNQAALQQIINQNLNIQPTPNFSPQQGNFPSFSSAQFGGPTNPFAPQSTRNGADAFGTVANQILGGFFPGSSPNQNSFQGQGLGLGGVGNNGLVLNPLHPQLLKPGGTATPGSAGFPPSLQSLLNQQLLAATTPSPSTFGGGLLGALTNPFSGAIPPPQPVGLFGQNGGGGDLLGGLGSIIPSSANLNTGSAFGSGLFSSPLEGFLTSAGGDIFAKLFQAILNPASKKTKTVNEEELIKQTEEGAIETDETETESEEVAEKTEQGESNGNGIEVESELSINETLVRRKPIEIYGELGKPTSVTFVELDPGKGAKQQGKPQRVLKIGETEDGQKGTLISTTKSLEDSNSEPEPSNDAFVWPPTPRPNVAAVHKEGSKIDVSPVMIEGNMVQLIRAQDRNV